MTLYRLFKLLDLSSRVQTAREIWRQTDRQTGREREREREREGGGKGNRETNIHKERDRHAFQTIELGFRG